MQERPKPHQRARGFGLTDISVNLSAKVEGQRPAISPRSRPSPCGRFGRIGVNSVSRRWSQPNPQILRDLLPRPTTGQCQPHRFTPKFRHRSVPVAHRTPPGSSVGALHFTRASPLRICHLNELHTDFLTSQIKRHNVIHMCPFESFS